LNESVVENINNHFPKNLKQTNIKDKFTKLKRAINSASLEEMFQNASSYVDKSDVSKILNIKPKENVFSPFKNRHNFSFLKYMMSVDYKAFMSDDVLTKVDRATMSVGLEGREPLLDHRIIEYMARVPGSIKYKNREGKYLLRQVLYKYLPKELVDKPKSGFQIPLNEWLRGDLKYLIDKYLDNNALDSYIFNIEEVQNLKDQFLNGRDIGTHIWFILVFQMWKEKWFE
jgi:asparagine synthase (glutamine-hydrolysing)